jgi:hypothetical protein
MYHVKSAHKSGAIVDEPRAAHPAKATPNSTPSNLLITSAVN